MSAPVSPRPDLTRILLMVLVTGLLIGGTFWILKPFLPSLLWAATIVIATWPAMERAQALLFGRRWIAVTLMGLAFLLLFAIPVGYGVNALVEYGPDVAGQIKDVQTLAIPQPPEWIGRLPFFGERVAAEWRAIAERGLGALLEQIAPYLKTVGAWLIGHAGGLGAFVVQLLLTLVLVVVLYTTGEIAATGARRFARRLGGERGVRAILLAAASIRAVALGIIVTALVQSVLGGIGLFVAGIPYAAVLTALMFVLCVAQLGPALVLFPAVAWLYWKDAGVAATVLLVWSLIVVAIDNLIRPLLIRRGADLPLLLIMAGVIGGLFAFGVIGLFVGPVILAVGFRLLQAWVDEGLANENDLETASPPLGETGPPR